MLHCSLKPTVMQHQNRSNTITANYKFGVAQSVDLATLRQGPSSFLRVRKKTVVFSCNIPESQTDTGVSCTPKDGHICTNKHLDILKCPHDIAGKFVI